MVSPRVNYSLPETDKLPAPPQTTRCVARKTDATAGRTRGSKFVVPRDALDDYNLQEQVNECLAWRVYERKRNSAVIGFDGTSTRTLHTGEKAQSAGEKQ